LERIYNSDSFNDINFGNKINIQGINQELIQSKGLTSLEIQTTKYIIPHNFHIVEITFSKPCDGILGIDFIKIYKKYINRSAHNRTRQYKLSYTCSHKLQLW